MSGKNLALAAALLALSITRVSAVSFSYSVDRDFAYSASSDPNDPFPALLVTGTWDNLANSSGAYGFSVWGLVNWDLDLEASVMDIAGTPVYKLSMEGKHLTGGDSDVAGMAIGLANFQGTAGNIFTVIEHNGAFDDHWLFHTEVNPANTLYFEIRAAHAGPTGVPDAGATTALLGAGLAGLALLRRRFC